MLQLHELCRDLGCIEPPEAGHLEIGRVDHDSRQVDDTSLFMALSGRQTSGLEYVEQALARGAVAIGLEKGSERPSTASAIVWFDEARRDMATLSARVTDHPQDKLEIVAVTGTNGKTSVTTLLHTILQEASVKSGLIGTIATRIGDLELPTNMTTPESTQLYRLLEKMVQEQVRVLCMEYSSVGIEEHRVDCTDPQIAVYLNLSQDHLDYHQTMANYGAAKTKLFTQHLAHGGTALVCVDDAFGVQLAERVEQQRPDVRCLRVSTTNREADVLGHLKPSAAGIQGHVTFDGDEFLVNSPLLGAFNCQNITVAVAAAKLLKVPNDKIQAGLLHGVIPGRLEKVPSPKGLHVVIDYAHTPDALLCAIDTLKTVAQGKCIVVFGCGGDRDQSKRSLMGEAASSADLLIVTSDNPRWEKPATIIEDIVEGVRCDVECHIEVDRANAIGYALSRSEVGDIVLIAGKGHERYQEVEGERRPYSDHDCVARWYGGGDR